VACSYCGARLTRQRTDGRIGQYLSAYVLSINYRQKGPRGCFPKKKTSCSWRPGPGTMMGELLRRYWMPIAAVAELDDNPNQGGAADVRKDLVLYRDKSGTYGLIDAHCPHRRADLSYGILEEDGLRCNYHGWLFNEEGRCLHQPFEETARPDSTSRTHGDPSRIASQLRVAFCGPTMGPKPARRWCRTTTSGRAGLQARCLRGRSRATGSSARKTASTRCTSSGLAQQLVVVATGEERPHIPSPARRLRRVRVGPTFTAASPRGHERR